jgi:hypothetical protein
MTQRLKYTNLYFSVVLYDRVTWSVTQRKERRLMLIENSDILKKFQNENGRGW